MPSVYPNIPTSEVQLRNLLGTSTQNGNARIQYPSNHQDWNIVPLQTWLPRSQGNPGMLSNGKLDDRVQLPAFNQTAQESIDFWTIMPKDYQLNTQYYIALDWSPTTDDGGNVRWALTITGFDHNADNSRIRFNGEWGMTYAHLDSTADGAPCRFKTVMFGPFAGWNRARASIIGRIYRDVNVDVPYDNEAWLATACLYYRAASLGSDGRLTGE